MIVCNRKTVLGGREVFEHVQKPGYDRREVFSDRVLSLICLRPIYNHRMMVAAGSTWSHTGSGSPDRNLIVT